MLVAPVPDRLGELGALYRSVARGWAELLADYDDRQLALILELFTRMRQLSDQQIHQVREGGGRVTPGNSGRRRA